MSQPLISLAMIVRDEADQLADCLESFAPFVDEIIVHDTGSTDDTRDVAAAHGARVSMGEWHDDFARARNDALAHCTGRWILSIDADERIDYMNGHRLMKAVGACERAADADDPGAILALAVAIESEIGRAGSGVSARHVFPRVFRRHPRIRWQGVLHEQVAHADFDVIKRTRLTDVIIQHHGYVRAEAESGRRERNARILARHHRDGASAFDRLSLAHSAMNLERFDEAWSLFEPLLAEGLPRNLDATARWSGSSTLMRLGRRAEARRLLEESAAKHPEHRSFPYHLAMLDLEDGRPIEARARFDTLLATPAGNLVDRTDVMPSRATMEVLRARTLLMEGDAEAALRDVESVLVREPHHPEGRFQRALCLDALQRTDEAVSVLSNLTIQAPDDPAIRAHLDRCRARLDARSAKGSVARPGLALCIIARNEASNLRELLPAMSPVADELIVVDTGSTDDTVAVAEENGARVVHHPWNDDFAAARNAGLDLVRHRWVLWLDGDERLSPASVPFVKAAVASETVDAIAVSIRSDHEDGDLVQASTGTYCRLFRADTGARFEGRIHEQVLPSLERAGARVAADERIMIDHQGYARDAETMRAKKLRNLALLERSVAEDPADSYGWFQLGVTLVALGRSREAIAPLRRAIGSMSDTTPGEIRLWSRLRLAQAAFLAGSLDEAYEAARTAADERPGVDFADYLQAGVWARRGRPVRALVCLRRIQRRDRPDPVAELRRDVVNADYEKLRSAIDLATASRAI